jgi:hypothetical protein
MPSELEHLWVLGERFSSPAFANEVMFQLFDHYGSGDNWITAETAEVRCHLLPSSPCLNVKPTHENIRCPLDHLHLLEKLVRKSFANSPVHLSTFMVRQMLDRSFGCS